MKKFFNIALLSIILGVSTTASAQHFGHYPHHDHSTVVVSNHYGPYHEHHYEHHSSSAAAGLLIGALVGGAIVAAAESSSHSTPAPQPVQPASYNDTYATSYSTGLQHYVNNGISYDSNESHARITNVVATPHSTTVYFKYLRTDKDYRIRVNQDIYLTDRYTNERLYPIACNGISMGTWTDIQCGYVHEYSITFPAVSRNCSSVDLIEPSTGGWKFYHVNF